MQTPMATNETRISLSEAVALFPKRNGKSVKVETLKRRIKHGCRGVKLYGIMSGACWYTTVEAVDRFHAELTAKEMGANDAPTHRETSKAAKDYLKRLGIGTSGKAKKEVRKGHKQVAKKVS
jgi:hypothetical protein